MQKYPMRFWILRLLCTFCLIDFRMIVFINNRFSHAYQQIPLLIFYLALPKIDESEEIKKITIDF